MDAATRELLAKPRAPLAWVAPPLLVLGFLSASTARAQSVVITPGPGVGAAAAELGLSRAELEALVQEEVEALFGLLDIGQFLRLSANAQAVVSSGQGADYASIPRAGTSGWARAPRSTPPRPTCVPRPRTSRASSPSAPAR